MAGPLRHHIRNGANISDLLSHFAPFWSQAGALRRRGHGQTRRSGLVRRAGRAWPEGLGRRGWGGVAGAAAPWRGVLAQLELEEPDVPNPGSQVRTYVARTVREPAMTDVARLAGVSHQTVSRVLNGHPNVREQTRLRVRAAIAELGYRPNPAARVLATGTSQVIGFVARSSTLYGPEATLTALAEAALQQGFAVSVESVRTLDRGPVADAIGRLLDQRVAGLVVIAPVEAANDALDDLPDDIPLVSVDGDPRRPTGLVTVDQEAGADAATTHLLRAGHPTVWHVSGPSDWFDAQGRVAGLAAGADRGGRRGPAADARRLVGRVRLSRRPDPGPDERRDRRVRRQRPPGPGHPAGAERAWPPRTAGRQRGRLRRCAGGGVLHPAADHRSARTSTRSPRPASTCCWPRSGPASGWATAGCSRRR